MGHDWQLDAQRTRMDINVLAWRCRICGCMQIKNGGLDAPSTYKRTCARSNPFETLDEEPACMSDDALHSVGAPAGGRV